MMDSIFIDIEAVEANLQYLRTVMQARRAEDIECGNDFAMSKNHVLATNIALKACLGSKPLPDETRYAVFANLLGLRQGALHSTYMVGPSAASEFIEFVYGANARLHEHPTARREAAEAMNYLYDGLVAVA
jgi:hypothetical protein